MNYETVPHDLNVLWFSKDYCYKNTGGGREGHKEEWNFDIFTGSF